MKLNIHNTKEEDPSVNNEVLPNHDDITTDDNPYQEEAHTHDAYDAAADSTRSSGNTTYSQEELDNPDSIEVEIADEETPIVVLFGPPASGKTMTLVRLARYLSDNGYEVTPVNGFRPACDENYKMQCESFNKNIYSEWAAESTKILNFMLLRIVDNTRGRGKVLCQILEAPGEHYFSTSDPFEPRRDFHKYINKIITSKNRKTWVYLVEPGWRTASDRKNYVEKIRILRSKTRSGENSIILFNKIDTTNLVGNIDGINISEAKRIVGNVQYKGLFDLFKENRPIVSLFKPYNCHFVPFVTGLYNKVDSRRESYTPSDDIFPARLWNVIQKCLRG